LEKVASQYNKIGLSGPKRQSNQLELIMPISSNGRKQQPAGLNRYV
jgi:hypothetical protein